MSFQRLVHLLKKHFLLISFFPLFTSGLVYYLTQNEVRFYSCSSSVYTGMITEYNSQLKVGVASDNLTTKLYYNMMKLMYSESILEELSVRLMAQHLSQDINNLNPKICRPYALQLLRYYLPDKITNKLVVKNDMDSTFKNMMGYLKAEPNNAIHRIIHSSPPYSQIPFYSLPYLRKLTHSNQKNSDVITSYYSSTDPGITLYTLIFFNDIFYDKYDQIKKNETLKVLAVFEEQLKKDKKLLDELEYKIMAFNTEYKILDFKSQIERYDSDKRDVENSIDNYYTELAALNWVKSFSMNQLDMRLAVLDINSDLIDKRDQLELLAMKYAMYETF
jgi:hypothetical protein